MALNAGLPASENAKTVAQDIKEAVNQASATIDQNIDQAHDISKDLGTNFGSNAGETLIDNAYKIGGTVVAVAVATKTSFELVNALKRWHSGEWAQSILDRQESEREAIRQMTYLSEAERQELLRRQGHADARIDWENCRFFSGLKHPWRMWYPYSTQLTADKDGNPVECAKEFNMFVATSENPEYTRKNDIYNYYKQTVWDAISGKKNPEK